MSGLGLQYHTYRSTKDVMKYFRCKQEEKLKDHLVFQGAFFSTAISQALSKLNCLWYSAQETCAKLFLVSGSNMSIPPPPPAKRKLSKWGLSSTSDCSICLKPESLLHVVAVCSTYLNEGCFTPRHNSMLHFIANSFRSVPDLVLYVDLPGFYYPLSNFYTTRFFYKEPLYKEPTCRRPKYLKNLYY